MIVNGHEYYLDDAIGKGFIDLWVENRDTLRKVLEQDADIQEVRLPINPSYIEYKMDQDYSNRITVALGVKNIFLNIKLLDLKWWEMLGVGAMCPLSAGNMKIDIETKARYDLVVNTSGVHLKRVGVDTYITRVGCNLGNSIIQGFMDLISNIWNDFWGFIIEFFGSPDVNGPVPNKFPKIITLIPLDAFASSGYGIVVADTTAEIESLINSFPIAVSFSEKTIPLNTNVYTGQHIKYNSLNVELSLMPGYGDNLSLYANGTPDLPHDPVLNLSGIAMNGDKYGNYPYNNANTWQDQISGVHDIIQNELGLTHVRVEAMWKYICPVLPSVNENEIISSFDEGFPNVTEQTIINFNNYIDDINQTYPQLPEGISEEKTGWQWLDIVINDIVDKDLTPLLIVGQGLSTSVPYAENENGQYKIIAPNTVRGDSIVNYINISREVYLYWLEVYATAVVQRYANLVQYWEAEDELNAARYTESFDWWRKGSAWHDDTQGGFLDQVANLLYNTIHNNDPVSSTKVVHAFHMFEMARCLDQWSDYYDIAGINFYPNELHAYPVFGFLVGEMVYSTKRALDALNLGDREVWVLETSYSDYCNEDDWDCSDPNNKPVFSGDNLYNWTEERQAQYLQEALETSGRYGADVFNWFNVVTSNDHIPGEGAGGTYSFINNYGGLYNPDGSKRLAFDRYYDVFNQTSEMDWVTFETKYKDIQDLPEGSFTVKNVSSGIMSGQKIRLNENIEYKATVMKPVLIREIIPDTIPVSHHNWNGVNSEYKITHLFTPNNFTNKHQNAIYDDQENVTFRSNPEFPDFHKSIKFADPWRLDAQNQQPNLLLTLEDTNVYNVFLLQNEQFHPDKPIYKLKAPNLFSSQYGIYEFTNWSGSDVSFENQDNRETAVAFLEAGATATASYTLVSNQASGVEAVIPFGEELIIPAGANFTCADAFTLRVEGELIIAGALDEPVEIVTEFDTFSPNELAFIDVVNGGTLYASGLQLTGIDDIGFSPPLIKAQPGSIVHLGHSTFNTNGTGIRVEDAHVELTRCVIHTDDSPEEHTKGVDIELNEDTHESWAETNNVFNQVLLENCTIRGMDKGIDIDININSSGYWKGLYVHNSILTENNTGIKGEGYLNSNIEFEYVNMSNNTNYEIEENIITSYIQTADPLLDNNHYPTNNSPVIDWGDPSSPFDPDGTIIDLGAYYKHQRPSTPTNFKIRGIPDNSPRLTYNSNEDHVHTWHILRKLGNQNDFTLLAVVHETQYIDNTVTIAADKKFSQDACYKVVAVDDLGYESNPTSSKCKAVEGNQDKLLNVPNEFALHHAFPNPFNPETTIKYNLPEQSQVQLTIFDLLGRNINTLKNQMQEAGYFSKKWNGRDENGLSVSSGVYIVNISAQSLESDEVFTQSQKVVLLK